MALKKENISNNVIRRLPRYLRKLDELKEKGVTRISSFELGKQLGFTPSQIRQDFSCFGGFGLQGYGYNVQELRDSIAKILGTDKGYSAVLIGAGHIGHALMDNFCFTQWGFRIVRAFDVAPEIIGKEFGNVKVSDMSELEDFLKENHVDMAVLTVPKTVAQEVANRVTGCGINAIWNFTNVELFEPDSSVIVENVHFSDSLLALSYFISTSDNGSSHGVENPGQKSEG